MRLRLEGLLLFSFIPAVLYLFLRQPVHELAALGLGVAIMFGHRLLAVPFMERNLLKRCIWSGAEIAPGCGYRVTSGGVERTFNSYIDPYRDHAARFFTFAQKYALPLRVLILGTLAYYLLAEILRALGVLPISHATNAAIFQGVIGLTMVLVFLLHRFVEPIPHNKGPVQFPFPVHNVFLLGIRWTLLVFAGVGAWFTVNAVRYVLAVATA